MVEKSVKFKFRLFPILRAFSLKKFILMLNKDPGTKNPPPFRKHKKGTRISKYYYKARRDVDFFALFVRFPGRMNRAGLSC